MRASLRRFVVPALAIALSACSRAPRTITPGVPWYPLRGPLIPSHMTMVTAWDVPKNPLTDPALDDARLSQEIRWGFRIFTNTPVEAARFTHSRGSCNNCHLNAGQRERSMPLVNVAGVFPEYNRRSGRLFSLEDRIVDCFRRSENGTAVLESRSDERAAPDAAAAGEVLPTTTSKEVLAVSAYLTWLSRGGQVGTNPSWRGQNTIGKGALIAVASLDPQRGEAIFLARCTNCHGADGQGVQVGDKRPGPLWGPDSWNDGAGAARVYTLAGIIRYTMPYLDPGSLSDEEAQLLARFITSKPRPAFPFKDEDYRSEPLPPDAVYYEKR